jgi:hypothetical protein
MQNLASMVVVTRETGDADKDATATTVQHGVERELPPSRSRLVIAPDIAKSRALAGLILNIGELAIVSAYVVMAGSGS